MRSLLALSVVLAACGPTATNDPGGWPTDDPNAGADPGTVQPPADGVCTSEPDSWLGHWCEFDAGCCERQYCLAGRCSVLPPSCSNIDQCPTGFTCTGGVCIDCADNLDCGPYAQCVGGICQPDGCPDGLPDAVGIWTFQSRLGVSEALPGLVLDIGDAAADACSWLESSGPLSGLPAWAPDLLCLAGDLSLLLHDMDVQHVVTIDQTGDVTWHARDSWQLVTFDPGGRNITVNPALLDCPIVVDDFDITYACGVLYMDRHHVELAVNGLVRLLLDGLACRAMDNQWGCSWDAAMDRVCASLGDPTAYATCLMLIDAVVIPDPCVDPADMNLAGTAHMTGAGRMAGDWAGTILGSDFTGTFTAVR